MGRSLRKPAGSDSANANLGSPLAGFLALSPPKLRWPCSMLGVARAARYFAIAANGIGKEGRN